MIPTIEAYYYYVRDSPIGDIVFYATDDENAENKFIRLVKKHANNNAFVDVDKYTIRRYPDARGHDSYILVSRRPENVKSKNIVILNEPSVERKKKDGRGWYVLYDEQGKVIAQSNFASMKDAIIGFGDGDIRGPFNSGVEIKRQKNKIEQGSLFEQLNLLIEEEVTSSELTEGQVAFLNAYIPYGKWKYINGVVNVDGNVQFTHGNHTLIPVQFGIVSGYFFCCANHLISLKGCPYEVGDDFRVWGNKLTSLEYMPTKIGGTIQLNTNEFILNDKLFEDIKRIGGKNKIGDWNSLMKQLYASISAQFSITNHLIINKIWQSYLNILGEKINIYSYRGK